MPKTETSRILTTNTIPKAFWFMFSRVDCEKLECITHSTCVGLWTPSKEWQITQHRQRYVCNRYKRQRDLPMFKVRRKYQPKLLKIHFSIHCLSSDHESPCLVSSNVGGEKTAQFLWGWYAQHYQAIIRIPTGMSCWYLANGL